MSRSSASVVCLLVGLGACGNHGTAEFGPPKSVPKDQRPMDWNASPQDRLGLKPMPPAKTGADDGPAKQWVAETPAGWEVVAANPAKFRDAAWRIVGEPASDIYFTASVGGGVMGNMTRWYTSPQQFGLASTPPVESLQVVDLAGKPGRLAEIEGTFNGKPDWAGLIAFTSQGDQITSLKFTGPKAIVLANKDKFLAVAKSLRSASVSPDPSAPPIQPGQPMPDNHPPVGNTPTTPSAPHTQPTATAAAPFTATVPSGWTPKPGTQRALHHTFGSGGEVYVSQLGGTLKPTLDIWRSEFQLTTPLTEAELAALPKLGFLGDDAVLLDLSGRYQGGMSGKQIANARQLVAARVDDGTITFVKMIGSADDVTAQVDAFRAFCASVRRAR